MEKKLTCSSARSPGTRKRTGSYLLNLYNFQSYICPKKAPFRVASLTDTHNKNIFVLFIFLAHYLKKKSYPSECPLTVDSHLQKKLIKKNLLARVPGQRRLTISRLRVPNLDGFVPTATGDLLSIGAPCHRCHTVTQKVSTRIKRDREKVY